MIHLFELDAYPRGQALIDINKIALIQPSPNGGSRIHFVGGPYVDVPHTFDDLRDTLSKAGVQIMQSSE